jgi:superfamily I DNA and/or RNA helicase
MMNINIFLSGDHKQLRPSIAVYELGKFFNFDVSLFERMANNREGCVTLQVQHRMCPEMAHLIVPSVYKTLDNHESVLDRPSVKSLPKRLFFKTHSEPEIVVSFSHPQAFNFEQGVFIIGVQFILQDRDSVFRKNEFEAEYLIALCEHLLKQGYESSEITVLATYTGQMFLIKNVSSFKCNAIYFLFVLSDLKDNLNLFNCLSENSRYQQ